MRLVSRNSLIVLGVAAISATLVAARDAGDAPTAHSRLAGASSLGTYGMRVAPLQLQSAGVMYFAPDGILFLADSRAGAVYAIDVAEQHRDTSASLVRIDDVDAKIAAALGTTRDQIRVHDMVAHPLSQSLYFSLTRGRGDDATPVVVSVTKVDEKVTVLPLENMHHARAALADAPSLEAKTPWGASKRTMAITDLALIDGELYVAGLSNEEFASALRRLPYPFGRTPARTTVEIYHTSHDKWETAAPIESFLPITLGGRPSLLAGYGCAPIVVFSRSDLTSKRHLRGKTISELGGGNRPLDMIRYVNASGKEYVLIANSHRTLTRLDPAEIATAPELTTSVKQAYEPAGVGYLPVASFGVLQLDNYNRGGIVLLERDAEDGGLNVVSRGLRWL
jgi:hypothetical protein